AAGVWESVSEKIVFGENVAQVLAYLARENVSCAFLPRHLARSQELGFTEVDISLYNPIEHVLVVPASAGNSSGGMSFAEFMLGSKSRAILRHNGFRTPDGGNQ
ncbi:MAG TPA: substrate-binding domain-containing protein, partial [Acidobacteriota bacterium]|nr:substrate-binding domain-containing protein [Acidobacteriota bacterium]